MPRRTPFDLAQLGRLGVSAQLAARYVETGWLVRLAQGVYAFPSEEVERDASLTYLQSRVPGFHIAGKSALSLQGVRHNLAARERMVVWGDSRFVLPNWFVSRFPARYVSARLFDWHDDRLARRTLTTPPGLTDGLLVSVPERAVLELLYDVGTHESLEEAHNLFIGLRSLRLRTLGSLLACCTSVKTVRLFLTWARESGVVDVQTLEAQFTLPVGSTRRWMTRLHDGTLLTLRPHG
jgi:hypothetical protein